MARNCSLGLSRMTIALPSEVIPANFPVTLLLGSMRTACLISMLFLPEFVRNVGCVAFFHVVYLVALAVEAEDATTTLGFKRRLALHVVLQTLDGRLRLLAENDGCDHKLFQVGQAESLRVFDHLLELFLRQFIMQDVPQVRFTSGFLRRAEQKNH